VSDQPWGLRLTRRAEKDLARLDPPVRRRVTIALRTLVIDPERASGVRKLTGRAESRLRVGDWRVLLELDRSHHEVVIYRVVPRGRTPS
jgi:mRNA interferase RelE/StbE